MIYNYYVTFLKSFKRMISSAFPGINHYQFNYGSKTYLNWSLYKEHIHEFPTCIVNIQDIQVQDNRDLIRSNGGKYSEDTLQTLCVNHDKKEAVVMDFKWVTITIQVKMNFDNIAELFDYHNAWMTHFPINFMFYSYAFQSYISVDNWTSDWINDNTEGLILRSFEDSIQHFALYNIEPIFKVTSVTKTRNVEEENSIDSTIEVLLKVPNVIGTQTVNDKIIDGIQIIINHVGDDNNGELPVLIDMDNNVYSDLRKKLTKLLVLDKTDFNTDLNILQLPGDLFYLMNNKPVAIYMVDDNTSNTPNIKFVKRRITEDNLSGDEICYDSNFKYYMPQIPFNTLGKIEFSNLNIIHNIELIKLDNDDDVLNFIYVTKSGEIICKHEFIDSIYNQRGFIIHCQVDYSLNNEEKTHIIQLSFETQLRELPESENEIIYYSDKSTGDIIYDLEDENV